MLQALHSQVELICKLPLGNNEIYVNYLNRYMEGHVMHRKRKQVREAVDNRLWVINELGQYELMTTDLSLSSDEGMVNISRDADNDERSN